MGRQEIQSVQFDFDARDVLMKLPDGELYVREITNWAKANGTSWKTYETVTKSIARGANSVIVVIAHVMIEPIVRIDKVELRGAAKPNKK